MGELKPERRNEFIFFPEERGESEPPDCQIRGKLVLSNGMAKMRV